MITIAALSAFIVSLAIYLYIGYYYSKGTQKLGDLIPVVAGRLSSVKNEKEFNASTTATSISLATVVLFFFEAAPGLGLWLLWCAITTAAGIFMVKIFANKIWDKMSSYNHRPSLHEFLGNEFSSRNVALVGAACTSLGYLGIFGLELYIGSIFLSGLVPFIPQWLVVGIISIIGFTYTAMGGFRTVVVTDRIQMFMIWLLIIGIFVFYGSYMLNNGGIETNLSKIPENVFSLSWSDNLISFIIGIFIINIAMFTVSMSIWQRIAASEKPDTVTKGLWSSALQTGLSWTLIILAACSVFIVIDPVEGENPLTTLISYAGNNGGTIGLIVTFCAVLGLFGSQLSTASTLLVATAHTLYEDVIGKYRNIPLEDRLATSSELGFSRIVLVVSAILAIAVVGMLSVLGFSIADLAFALYGGQLSLFAPVLFALLLSRSQLKELSRFASSAVIFGIGLGWVAAFFGKIYNYQDLVFLSPLISLGTSAVILMIGYIVKIKTIKQQVF